MKAVGLPPQTFGREVAAHSGPGRLLMEKELENCHLLMVNLAAEAKKEKFDL